MYRMVCEDATKYLPHDPTGIEYTHYVYNGEWVTFTGTRKECEQWVLARQANDRREPGELGGYWGNR